MSPRYMHKVIPLTIPHGELVETASAFLQFLVEVPDEAKRRVHFKSHFHRGSANGYCDVRNIKGKDPKEYFHWATRLLEEPGYHEVAAAFPAAHAFFSKAERIYRASEQMAEEIFRLDYPQHYGRCFDADGRLFTSQLRILCYTPTPVPFRAKGHYDKGFGALALGESSAGLRVGCCKEHPMLPVRHNDGTAIFMPAQLMWDDSKHTIIPTWHDVVPDESVPHVSDRCARWAIVLFVNDKDGRFPEWEDTHRPLPVHETEYA